MWRLQWSIYALKYNVPGRDHDIKDASINHIKYAFDQMDLFLDSLKDSVKRDFDEACLLLDSGEFPSKRKRLRHITIMANARLTNTKAKIEAIFRLLKYAELKEMQIYVDIYMGQDALDGTQVWHKCKGNVQRKTDYLGIPEIETGILVADATEIFTQVFMGSKEWLTDYTWEPSIALPAPVIQVEATVDEAFNNDRKLQGVIYLLKAGDWYKIGKTIDPQGRMRQLDIQLPEKTEKLHEIHTDNIDLLERHWHRYFADRRGNGEWFRLTAEDIAEFKAYRRIEMS